MSLGRSRFCFDRPVRSIVWLFLVCLIARADSGLAKSPPVFDGLEASYTSSPPVSASSPEVLRWVWVQERMKIARRDAPVRVPIFFSVGECRDLNKLVLVRWPSRQPVPV